MPVYRRGEGEYMDYVFREIFRYVVKANCSIYYYYMPELYFLDNDSQTR